MYLGVGGNFIAPLIGPIVPSGGVVAHPVMHNINHSIISFNTYNSFYMYIYMGQLSNMNNGVPAPT